MLARKNAVIKTIEGKRVVLFVDNEQFLAIDRDELQKPFVGEEYVIEILPLKEAELKKEALAKEIINQLLENDQRPESDQKDEQKTA